MADKNQIAIAEEKAVAQLSGSARALAELVGAPALELPDNPRDPYLRSGQMRTVATYLDSVAGQVQALIAERVGTPAEQAAVEPPAVEPMFDDDVLRHIAYELGVLPPGDLSRDELIRVIGAHGMTSQSDKPVKPAYNELSVEALEALLDERGIDRGEIRGSGKFDRVVKVDLMAALEAYDEGSERAAALRSLDEQSSEETGKKG